MTNFKPDEGRAWLVLVAAFLGVGLITDGIGYSFGLIYTELLSVYNETNERTSWIGSFQQSIGLLFAFPLSFLLNKLGCRLTAIAMGIFTSASLLCSVFAKNLYILYISFGFFTGIGLMGIEFIGQVAIQRAFVRKRLLANGIATSGTGFGMLIMGPVVYVLLSHYGLHGTFLILSGICLNEVVFGLLIPDDESLKQDGIEYQELHEHVENELEGKVSADTDKDETKDVEESPNDPEEDALFKRASNGNSQYNSTDSSKSLSMKEIEEKETNRKITEASKSHHSFFRLLCNVDFMLFSVGSVLSHGPYKVTTIFFPDRARADFNLSSQQTAMLVSILGAMHILARPVVSLLGDASSPTAKQLIYAISALAIGVTNFSFLAFDSMLAQVLFVVVLGMASAVLITYEYPVLCDVISMHDLEIAAGLSQSLLGIGVLGLVPLAAWFVDITGNYRATFIFLGSTEIIAFLLLVIVPIRTKFKSRIK